MIISLLLKPFKAKHPPVVVFAVGDAKCCNITKADKGGRREKTTRKKQTGHGP